MKKSMSPVFSVNRFIRRKKKADCNKIILLRGLLLKISNFSIKKRTVKPIARGKMDLLNARTSMVKNDADARLKI